MRLRLAVTALLAACVLSTAAIAANDQVKAQFESLAASGVTGEASLNPMPFGELKIHGSLRGLEPNTDYVAVIFDQSQTCGEGTSSQVLIQFTANPAGIATWNSKIVRELSTVESIGIRRVQDNALQACAAVVEQ